MLCCRETSDSTEFRREDDLFLCLYGIYARGHSAFSEGHILRKKQTTTNYTCNKDHL